MAIIMISRGTFSGGKAVAERVAGRLGYPCLSREETVRDVVAKYGIPEEELTAAMNEPPRFWQQIQGRRLSYIKVFSSTLMEHIKGENLVYHGHIAHLMLGPVSHVLRVRVIANMEFRIKGAMARKKLSRIESIDFINRIDDHRDRWTRYLYGVEWKNASLYDVLFNLEHLSVDATVDTIIHMAKMDAFKPTPESRKIFDDLILGSRVWAALAINGQMTATKLTVCADAGKVTISGGVPWPSMIRMITDTAQRVEGVQEVETNVGVGPAWYW